MCRIKISSDQIARLNQGVKGVKGISIKQRINYKVLLCVLISVNGDTGTRLMILSKVLAITVCLHEFMTHWQHDSRLTISARLYGNERFFFRDYATRSRLPV